MTTMIPVDNIIPNPMQPRQEIPEEELVTLAANISQVGLINPIAVVEPDRDGLYVIVDGERRWRAHKLLGWKEIKADIQSISILDDNDQKLLLQAVSANVHRSDMTIVEEAKAIQKMQENGMNLDEIARLFGHSEFWVSSRLDLLTFPEGVQELFASKRLGFDLRTLAALRQITDPKDMTVLAIRCANRKMGQKGIKIAVSRYLLSVQGKKFSYNEREKKTSGKAMFYEKIPSGGSLSWFRVRSTIKTVCENCVLAEFADQGGCKECPMLDFIKRVTTKESGDGN